MKNQLNFSIFQKNINFLFNKAIDILKFEINPIRLHNIIHVSSFNQLNLKTKKI